MPKVSTYTTATLATVLGKKTKWVKDALLERGLVTLKEPAPKGPLITDLVLTEAGIAAGGSVSAGYRHKDNAPYEIVVWKSSIFRVLDPSCLPPEEDPYHVSRAELDAAGTTRTKARLASLEARNTRLEQAVLALQTEVQELKNNRKQA